MVSLVVPRPIKGLPPKYPQNLSSLRATQIFLVSIIITPP